MANTYLVSWSLAASGPWTSDGQGAHTAPPDTITGLQANTSYFFQIIVRDSVSGISGNPVVGGPFTTLGALTAPGTPVASNIANTTLTLTWPAASGP